MIETPEHDKMRAVRAEADAIAGFLEWLEEREVVLAVYPDPDSDEAEEYGFALVPWSVSPDGISGIEKRLAAYLDIDLDKISAEKDAMLDDIRHPKAK